VGGFLSHFLNKRSAKAGGARGKTIRERGVIIASGLMAGGALGGVLGAAMRLIPGYREDLVRTPFYSYDPVSQSVSALLFVGLCLYVWFGSLKKEKVI
jgi:membrane associated rhomboid family serine protease